MFFKSYALAKLARVVFVGLVFFLSVSALAESIKSEVLYQLSLTDLLSVKISGVSLREQQILDSPASISVVNQRAIEKLGVTTLIELLRFVPGFQTFRTSESNNQSIAARGRSGAAASREILLIIDGVRIESWWLGASVFSVSPVSLEGVKKVEFIRGPVSQIYGSNAFTGVINIETGGDQSSVSLETGNLEHARLATSLHFTHGKHKHTFILDGFTQGGEHYVVADPFGSSDNISISDPKDYLSLSYRWRSPQWSAQFMLIENQTDDFFAGGGANEAFNRIDVRHYHINFKHQNKWRTDLSTYLSFGYKSLLNRFEIPFSGENPFPGLSSPPNSDPLVGFAEEDTFEYWADGNLLYETEWNLDIQSGFEVRHRGVDDVIGRTNYDLVAFFNDEIPIASSDRTEFPALVGRGADENQLGVFTTFTYRVGKAVLSLGGRFDDYEIAGTQFTPRASAVFKLNPEHALKLIYGEAFRSPAHIELFTVNNLNVLGNPNLNPEVVNTLEAIWHHETESRRLQFGWFYNQFVDTIGVNVTQDGLREFLNLGESQSQGVEFSWLERLNDRWTARVAASDLLHKPDDMFRLADETANVMLSYWRDLWIFTADVAYTGEREYVHIGGDIRPIDSYTLFNLHFAYSLSSNLDFNMTALNVFDKRYDGPSEGQSAGGIPARGVEFKAGLKYRF